MAMRSLFLPLCICVISYLLCVNGVSFLDGMDGQADPSAVIMAGNARFTVLTERVIRMEYGRFHDNATFAFINRRLPVPLYTQKIEDGWLHIQTGHVLVKYKTDATSGFDATNLEVTELKKGKQWKPLSLVGGSNAQSEGTLPGTVRTLDARITLTNPAGVPDLNCHNSEDEMHCTFGLLSKDGLLVVDDSGRPHFDQPGSLTPQSQPWWYHPNREGKVNDGHPDECPNLPVADRQDCGHRGIDRLDCEGRGCCYLEDAASANGPWCFYGPRTARDLYAIAQGDLDYAAVISDFTKLSGKMPLPPRYAFGVWYSRYWEYADSGLRSIVGEYSDRDIPLDTLVIDMDWHYSFVKEHNHGARDQAGEMKGWTGYTWDKNEFSNPRGFLSWAHQQGLHATANLHPAGGIEPWEDTYQEMARAMGIDPATNKYVPFHPDEQRFAQHWVNITLAKREEEGIDFWWLDWQQGEQGWIKVPDMNPTFWLNHIFWTKPIFKPNVPNAAAVVDPNARPLIFHRWGGLGNHRYPIGFSGDVKPSWAALEYEVYFTAAAANVLYGYWSHDIGGHTEKPGPELYTRWVQFGAFSPVLRTHCTKNSDNDRRIWMYPNENYEVMRRAMRVREEFVPYIYTMARAAYDTGISLVRPMYYGRPQDAQAYSYTAQYMFGEDIMVAPVTSEADKNTIATKKVWIPTGEEYYLDDWGVYVKGPAEADLYFTLSELPVLSKVGSIIPKNGMLSSDSPININIKRRSIGLAQELPDVIRFEIPVGGVKSLSSKGVKHVLYEDDGKTTDYEKAAWVKTGVAYKAQPGKTVVVIIPPLADNTPTPSWLPPKRAYQVVLKGVWPPSDVTINNALPVLQVPLGAGCPVDTDCWTYDGTQLALIINLAVPRLPSQAVHLTMTSPPPKTAGGALGDASECERDVLLGAGFVRLVRRAGWISNTLDEKYMGRIVMGVYKEDYPSLMQLSEAGNRISYEPSNAYSIVKEAIDVLLPQARSELKGALMLEGQVREMVEALLNTDDIQRVSPPCPSPPASEPAFLAVKQKKHAQAYNEAFE